MKATVALILDCFGPNSGIPEPQVNEDAAHRRARSLLTSYYFIRQNPEDSYTGLDKRKAAVLEALDEEKLAKLEPKSND